jgi:hypothetical protein
MACDNLIICQQGATIVDRAVIITPAENYQLPPEAHKQLSVIIYFTFYDMILISSYIKFRRKLAILSD